MDKALIEQGVSLILRGLGVDPTDHNFYRTPERVARVYEELFRAPETGYPVFDEDYTDMVLLKGHTFYTMCPHHLLLVKIKAHVAYIPGGRVIGASKLMRIIHDINNQPRTQEDLTNRVVKHLKKLTGDTSRGEAILMTGSHDCFHARGVKSDASMVTFKFGGDFERELGLQNRFFQLIGNGA